MKGAPFSGNNQEAGDFARDIQDLNTKNGMANRTHLDLVPSYTGTLNTANAVRYRSSVNLAVMTIILEPAGLTVWQRSSLNGAPFWWTARSAFSTGHLRSHLE